MKMVVATPNTKAESGKYLLYISSRLWVQIGPWCKVCMDVHEWLAKYVESMGNEKAQK